MRFNVSELAGDGGLHITRFDNESEARAYFERMLAGERREYEIEYQLYIPANWGEGRTLARGVRPAAEPAS